MTVGADTMAGVVTLDGIRLITTNLAVNTTLGASNVPFGLPERSLINRFFFSMAVAAGLTSAIVDPLALGIRTAVAASYLLMGPDEDPMRFLRGYRTVW